MSRPTKEQLEALSKIEITEKDSELVRRTHALVKQLVEEIDALTEERDALRTILNKLKEAATW